MTINFDLISDLNLSETDDYSWNGKATSLFCIVAGNISSDHDVVFDFLEELSQYYEGVFFIDGELEHQWFDGDLEGSYASLISLINEIDNVMFLHENIILMNGATLLATNGWTTFNFTNQNSLDETIEFLEARDGIPAAISNEVFKQAISDQHYMYNSIESCQTLTDCQNIVVITNSVPRAEFIKHDVNYDGTVLGDTAGNNGIVECLQNDTEGKVSTWLFGKYQGDLDFDVNGVRYVNNPRQKRDLDCYYPKVITF